MDRDLFLYRGICRGFYGMDPLIDTLSVKQLMTLREEAIKMARQGIPQPYEIDSYMRDVIGAS